MDHWRSFFLAHCSPQTIADLRRPKISVCELSEPAICWELLVAYLRSVPAVARAIATAVSAGQASTVALKESTEAAQFVAAE